jgi:hypothetical protein
MIRTLLVTIGLIALAGAVTLRINDRPYIRYMHGDTPGALDGLTERAQANDGFAAYLLAYLAPGDSRRAKEWLMAAVVHGEDRAAAPFLLAVARDDRRCTEAVPLLEMLARARDARAALILGDIARDGICAPTDLAHAAGYYSGAARLEPVFEHRFETLPPFAQDAPVRPLPERYDVTREDARTRFMAEAPALLARR